jgi:hypothetical protein
MQVFREHDTSGAVSPAVIVLGMHRSGTSLCASLLQECGIAMVGRDERGFPTEGNLRGHFERWDVVLAHRRILEVFGQRYDSLTALPPLWWRRPELAEPLAAMERLVAANRGPAPWGFKDPRAMRLFRAWRTLLETADQPFRLVLCLRRPSDVARSLAKRDGTPVETGLALWLRHHADFLTANADLSWQVVDFDDWFLDPDPTLTRLLGGLGVVAVPDEPARREILERIVSTGLRRSSRPDTTPTGLDVLYEAVKDTCQSRPRAPEQRRQLAARLHRACRIEPA